MNEKQKKIAEFLRKNVDAGDILYRMDVPANLWERARKLVNIIVEGDEEGVKMPNAKDWLFRTVAEILANSSPA